MDGERALALRDSGVLHEERTASTWRATAVDGRIVRIREDTPLHGPFRRIRQFTFDGDGRVEQVAESTFSTSARDNAPATALRGTMGVWFADGRAVLLAHGPDGTPRPYRRDEAGDMFRHQLPALAARAQALLDSAMSPGTDATTTRGRDPDVTQSCTLSVKSEPLLRIAGDAPDVGQFYNVSGAALLPDGRVAVSSSGTHAVLLFDSAGALQASFGRRGRGPQEFQALAGLWRVSDSTLLVSDPFRSQVTFLSNTLGFLRREQLDVGAQSRWQRVIGTTSGSILAINGQAFERGQLGTGVVRPPFQFLRYSHAGQLLDTVASVPGRAFFVPPLGEAQATQAVPFGRTVLFAVADDTLVTLDTDVPALRFRTLDGKLERTEEFEEAPVAITRTQIDQYMRVRREEARTAEQQRLASALAQIPVPRTFPLADELTVGQDGSIWLRLFPTSTAPLARWLVLPPERGTFCTVHLPAGLRVFDADVNRVLGTYRDADDLETITVLRIERGGRTP